MATDPWASAAPPASSRRLLLLWGGVFLVLLLSWLPLRHTPVYPDEVAFRLISARWLSQGLRSTGVLSWLCSPEGLPLQPFFLPAAAALQGLNRVSELPGIQRPVAMGVLSGLICLSQALAQRRWGWHPLLLLPIGVAMFGTLPIYLTIQRPELLWSAAALMLLASASLAGQRWGRLALAISALLFYLGSATHPEFLLLLPALLITGWQVLRQPAARLAWLLLLLLSAWGMLSGSEAMKECAGLPHIARYMSEVSTPALGSVPNMAGNVAKGLIVGGRFSPLDTLPPLPASRLRIGLQATGLLTLGMLWGLTVVTSSLAVLHSLRRGPVQAVLQHPRLPGLLLLVGCILLIGADPNQAFYRTVNGLLVGSVVVSQHLRLRLRGWWPVSTALLLALALLASWGERGTLVAAYRNGYGGPSLPQNAWATSQKRPLPEELRQFVERHPGRRILIDDATYGLVRDHYEQLLPISYAGLAISRGESAATIRGVIGSDTPVLLQCSNPGIAMLAARVQPLRPAAKSSGNEEPEGLPLCAGVMGSGS
jgi:hypothetical protein